jgi:hypothetical protein
MENETKKYSRILTSLLSDGTERWQVTESGLSLAEAQDRDVCDDCICLRYGEVSQDTLIVPVGVVERLQADDHPAWDSWDDDTVCAHLNSDGSPCGYCDGCTEFLAAYELCTLREHAVGEEK